MENKKIISEVSRINEIMGVGGKMFLSEDNPRGEIAKELVSVIKNAFKGLTREIPSELGSIMTRLESREVETAVKAIDDLFLYIERNPNMLPAAFRTELKTALAQKFISQNGENMISRLSREFQKGLEGGEKTTYDYMVEAAERGNTDDQFIVLWEKEYRPNTGDPVLDEWLKTQTRNEIRSKWAKASLEGAARREATRGATSTRQSTPRRNTGSTPSTGGATTSAETPGLFSWERWEWNIKRLSPERKQALAKAASENKTLYDNTIGGSLKNWEKRVDYIQQLGAAWEKTTNSQARSRIELQMRKELEDLGKDNFEAYRNMYRWLDEVATDYSNKGMYNESKTIRQLETELKRGEFYTNWFTVIDATATEGTASRLKQNWEGFKAAWTRLFGEVWFWGNWKRLMGKIKIWERLGMEQAEFEAIAKQAKRKGGIEKYKWTRSEFANTLIYGSRRGLPGMENPFYRRLIERYGYNSALYSYYFEAFILRYFKWEVWKALADTLVEGYAFLVKDEGFVHCMEKVDEYKKEHPQEDIVVENNVDEIMKNLGPDTCNTEDPWFRWAAEFTNSGGFVQSLGGNIMEELFDDWGLVEMAIPGVLDDAVMFGIDFNERVATMSTAIGIREWMGKRKEDLEKISERTETGMEETGEDAKNWLEDKIGGGSEPAVTPLDEFPSELLSEIPEGYYEVLKIVNKSRDEYALDYSEYGGETLPIKKYNGEYVIYDNRLEGWILLKDMFN